MRKLQNVAAMGSFTDFNVWSVELSEEEMKDFTKCVRMMKGNLIPWNISDWMFTPDIQPDEYSQETVEFHTMCSTNVTFLTLFPNFDVISSPGKDHPFPRENSC